MILRIKNDVLVYSPENRQTEALRLPRQIIGLAIWFENDVLSDPPMFASKIDERSFHQTAHAILLLVSGATVDDLPRRAIFHHQNARHLMRTKEISESYF